MRYPNTFTTIAMVAALLGGGPAFAAGTTMACYEQVHQPAVYKSIKRTIMTQRAKTHWEYQTVKGRSVLCKVHSPAVYQIVVQNVMVQPERTVLRPVRTRDCKQNARIYSNF